MLVDPSTFTVKGTLPDRPDATMLATGGRLSGGVTVTTTAVVAVLPPSSVTVSVAVKEPPAE